MSDPQPTDPLHIRALQESLINRIAAGEIIHRPASALKELLENSLDAQSTSIRITVKDGGMKLLQIQDNGSGIRKADLPILAERFTTSKISDFSDLSSLTTYGFRGEALASISHVAQLTVVTKTKSEGCAWKASYVDGKMSEGPKPCAGNDGTTITIENLFYNTPTRIAALRSVSDEYARILDVVTKYAVHNPSVAFMCKKAASSSPTISTPASSSVDQAIRVLYGHSIAKELLQADCSGEVEDSKSGTWKATAHFTTPVYQAKKMIFLLFINHRLVDSPRLKRALESIYTGILPKGTSPFVYLSLVLPPDVVDVNVHPTKSAVHFLNEDGIIEAIASDVQRVLTESSSRSREYDVHKQTTLTDSLNLQASSSKVQDASSDKDEEEPAKKKVVYSHNKVRTSQQDRTLDSMFPILNPGQVSTIKRDKGKGKAIEDAVDVDDPVAGEEDVGGYAPATQNTGTPAREVKESECNLTSVLKLRDHVKKGRHKTMTEILREHIFVGIVDMNKGLSVVQHSTKLYLVNHSSIAEELFYQLGLRQFGDMSKIKLHPPPPLRTLVEVAVEAEAIPSETENGKPLNKADIVQKIVELLMSRRDMLAEYFSLNISASGNIESIPLLLPGYTPNLDKLPSLLMRLGPQVNWQAESECFETFLRELAYFYVPGPLQLDQTKADAAKSEMEETAAKAERWEIQHVLFPALRRYLVAPKTLLDEQAVLQVANLPDLYKVFERC